MSKDPQLKVFGDRKLNEMRSWFQERLEKAIKAAEEEGKKVELRPLPPLNNTNDSSADDSPLEDSPPESSTAGKSHFLIPYLINQIPCLVTFILSTFHYLCHSSSGQTLKKVGLWPRTPHEARSINQSSSLYLSIRLYL